MKLKIKQSSWSGRAKNYKPVEIENEYELKLNEKYIIKTTNISYIKDRKMITEEREIFSFEIIEIDDLNIKIHTYQPFSDNKGNTINLLSKKQEFIVGEEELKLVTPSTDAGLIFILKLIK